MIFIIRLLKRVKGLKNGRYQSQRETHILTPITQATLQCLLLVQFSIRDFMIIIRVSSSIFSQVGLMVNSSTVAAWPKKETFVPLRKGR